MMQIRTVNGAIVVKGMRARCRSYMCAARNKIKLCLGVTFATSLILTNQALALGIGAAEIQSHIGQPVNLSIALFNVENPQSLSVKLSNLSTSSLRGLRAEIDRSNSQLGVLIVSQQKFNEPYLNFTLELVDDGNPYTKEFTVLLELAETSDSLSAPTRGNTIESSQQNAGQNTQVNSQSVLGPYQWAQPGQIPERFGAVLDGQSLWRVARRINSAMGVSLNQMMWALYEQNPQAFNGRSVSSLQAGSYLTIPKLAEVNQLSDGQAKAMLESLNQATSPIALADNAERPNSPVQSSPTSAANAQPSARDESSSTTAPMFGVSGLDQAIEPSQAGNSADQSSQMIITSLAQTVGNLTQELISKDKKISFLEEKVAALETYAGIDAKNLVQASDANKQGANKPDNSDSARATPVGTDSVTLASASADGQVAIIDSAQKSPSQTEQSSKLGSILALGLFLTIAMGVIFRQRLLAVWRSLNFIGANREIEFASVMDESDELLAQSPYQEPDKDYSIMHAVDHTLQDTEALEGISYLSLEEDGHYSESAEEPDEVMMIDDDEELSFSERFERLLHEKDYDFARELLEFARYNDIDDQQYHCNRLRLFKAMRDEDGFYEYYYEIESKIPQFEPHLQTKISQLVVKLAQH